MTVILGFMAVAIFFSLFVAHLASSLTARWFDSRPHQEDLEVLDRLSRDQRYSKLL